MGVLLALALGVLVPLVDLRVDDDLPPYLFGGGSDAAGTDDDGRVRVVLQRPDIADLLDGALAQPRRYGADAPNVLERLFQELREVAWRAPDDDARAAVREQLARLQQTVRDGGPGEVEKQELRRAAHRVEQGLAQRW